MEDEDSTIRQFRQHAVRRHVAVSLGFIPHDISASSPVGLANPRQAQRALLRSASVLRPHQSTDETRKRDEDATTAVEVGAGASGQHSYQHCTSIISRAQSTTSQPAPQGNCGYFLVKRQSRDKIPLSRPGSPFSRVGNRAACPQPPRVLTSSLDLGGILLYWLLEMTVTMTSKMPRQPTGKQAMWKASYLNHWDPFSHPLSPSSHTVIRPMIHTSNQPSIQPSIKPSIQPSNYPQILLSHPLILQLVHLSNHPFIQPSIQPLRQPPSHPLILLSQQLTRQSTHLPNHPSTQPPSQPLFQPSSHSLLLLSHPLIRHFIHLSIYLSIQTSTQPLIQPLNHPLILFSHPLIRQSIHPSNQLLAQPSIQPTIQPSSHSLFPLSHSLIRRLIHPSTHPSTHLLFQPLIQIPNQLQIPLRLISHS